MARQPLDFDTMQADGRRGELAPQAFHKIDEMFEELYKSWTSAKNKLLTTDANGAPLFSDVGAFGLQFAAMNDVAAALVKLGLGVPTAIGKNILTGADDVTIRQLLGLNLLKSGARFSGIPRVAADGTIDIGQIIDFHDTNSDTGDFSGRLSTFGGKLYWTDPTLDTNGRAVMTQHNIVGTVGYSGNYPSGSIIERGSNANGVYTRYADGTQICRAVFDQNIAFGNPYASGFYGVFGWDYPAGFKPGNIPSVIYAAKPQGGLCLTAGGIDPGDANVTRYTALPFAFVNATMATRISLVAIGEWR